MIIAALSDEELVPAKRVMNARATAATQKYRATNGIQRIVTRILH